VAIASGGQETAGSIEDKKNTVPPPGADAIANMEEIEEVIGGGDRAHVTEEGEIGETVAGMSVEVVTATVGGVAATAFEAGAEGAIDLEVGLETTENTEAGGAINLAEDAVEVADAEEGEAEVGEVAEAEVAVEGADARKIAFPSKSPHSQDRPLDTNKQASQKFKSFPTLDDRQQHLELLNHQLLNSHQERAVQMHL